MLRNLIRSETIQNGIIFCNRKRDVAVLHKSLVKHGFNAGALHGDMDQRSRTETLDKFRAGEITLLAASDVAARGLDIPEVSHVFNFDLPWHSDDYVHRIGRTGRAGREGAAFSIVTLEDLKLLKDIQKITGDTAEWVGEQPTPEDFEDAGKRRRSRGGPAKSDGRGASARSDGQSGQRRDGRGSRPAREGRSDRPARGAERRPEGHEALLRDETSVIADAPAVEALAGEPRREAPSGEHRGRRDRGPRRERASGPNAPVMNAPIVRIAPIARSAKTGPNVSCAKRPNSLVSMHLLPGVKTVRVPSGSPITAANGTNAAIISVPSRASNRPTANPLPGPLRISAPRSVPPRDRPTCRPQPAALRKMFRRS